MRPAGRTLARSVIDQICSAKDTADEKFKIQNSLIYFLFLKEKNSKQSVIISYLNLPNYLSEVGLNQTEKISRIGL